MGTRSVVIARTIVVSTAPSWVETRTAIATTRAAPTGRASSTANITPYRTHGAPPTATTTSPVTHSNRVAKMTNTNEASQNESNNNKTTTNNNKKYTTKKKSTTAPTATTAATTAARTTTAATRTPLATPSTGDAEKTNTYKTKQKENNNNDSSNTSDSRCRSNSKSSGSNNETINHNNDDDRSGNKNTVNKERCVYSRRRPYRVERMVRIPTSQDKRR